ncbi:MAG: helix-hairpin-helix domain-containing protein, partial [Patescibacteria group bacterium]
SNIINSIQSKKQIKLERFLFALGIPQVGEETAFDLVKYLGSLEKIKNSSFEELQRVRDIGPKVAESIYKWFKEKRNLEFLDKLRKIGIKIVAEKKIKFNPKIKDKTFLFTGGLETLTREKAEEIVREQGGDVSSSVSENVDWVVVGSEPGSKYDKAKKLGVKIINENEFLKMIR